MIKRFLPLFVLFALVTSCVNEENVTNGTSGNDKFAVLDSMEEYNYKGRLKICLNEELLEDLNVNVTRSGLIETGYPEFDRILTEMGAFVVKRSVPDAGEFEARHREFGLHLWYDIYFDESYPITRAGLSLSELDIFKIIEPVGIKVHVGGGEFFKIPEPNPTTQQLTRAGSPFNDPRFSEQWHYYNDGSMSGSVAGADINLLEAWKITTGDPRVIVAIIDNGMDYTHEDLVANLWVNPNPNQGGFVNDIYGYNFCETYSGSVIGTIEKNGEHGTHVGGTVAAVNNNGIGVAGVAGGDGTSGSGVRIMTCQIMSNVGTNYDGDVMSAFAYAADHGAVIAQNSWGYMYTSQSYASDLAAIKYFIANAKSDMMDGGIVIFAAGNEATSSKRYPGAYDEVISVAAMNNNFKLSSYSNYGTWVDITAPGGADYNETGILSTYPGSQYEFFPGTSMACPHVSGIAALAISVHGSPTFTPDELKAMILDGVRNDVYEFNAARYEGRLGSGNIDAYKVLNYDGTIDRNPGKVTNFSGEWGELSVTLKWDIVADYNDLAIGNYEILVNTSPVAAGDFMIPPASAKLVKITVTSPAIGSMGTKEVTGLEHSTKYYAAIVAIDTQNRRSEPVSIEGTTTTKSIIIPPRIGDNVIVADDDVTLFPNPVTEEILYLKFGNNLTGNAEVMIYNTSGSKILSGNAAISEGDDVVSEGIASFDVSKLPAGIYTIRIIHPSKEFKKSLTKL